MMRKQDNRQRPTHPPDEAVRPVGAWVVGGFLIVTIVIVWSLASLVFLNRS